MIEVDDRRQSIEDPQAGLTLIEMVVAMAIGALVVAFVAQGSGMIRSFGRLGTAVSAQDETLAVRDHLREVIASTLAVGTGPQRNSFAGIGDTVVFTAPGDRLLESGAPVRITLAALPDHGRMALVETRAPLEGGGGNPAQRTRRLVAGADRVSFSYFGGLSGDVAPAWSTEWTDPEVSPALVRIDLVFPPGDARRWPPFVVRMPSARFSATPAPQASAANTGGAAQEARPTPSTR